MPASSLQSCPRSSPRRARNALLSVLGTSSHMKKNKGWVSMPFEGSQVFSEGFDNFSSYSCSSFMFTDTSSSLPGSSVVSSSPNPAAMSDLQWARKQHPKMLAFPCFAFKIISFRAVTYCQQPDCHVVLFAVW